jgi:hypothetical protein
MLHHATTSWDINHSSPYWLTLVTADRNDPGHLGFLRPGNQADRSEGWPLVAESSTGDSDEWCLERSGSYTDVAVVDSGCVCTPDWPLHAVPSGLGGFTARIPDIPAYGEGETEEEAIVDLKEALRAYIEAFGIDDALARANVPLTVRPLDWTLQDLTPPRG